MRDMIESTNMLLITLFITIALPGCKTASSDIQDPEPNSASATELRSQVARNTAAIQGLLNLIGQAHGLTTEESHVDLHEYGLPWTTVEGETILTSHDVLVGAAPYLAALNFDSALRLLNSREVLQSGSANLSPTSFEVLISREKAIRNALNEFCQQFDRRPEVDNELGMPTFLSKGLPTLRAGPGGWYNSKRGEFHSVVIDITIANLIVSRVGDHAENPSIQTFISLTVLHGVNVAGKPHEFRLTEPDSIEGLSELKSKLSSALEISQ